MSEANSPRSPFAEGFAALGREPALLPAELVWRWCFGLAAWTLAIVSAGLFLDSLTISPADELLLGTLQIPLLKQAAQHIFQGSLPRAAWMQAILLVGLTFLWAFAATAGRSATLHRLIAMLRDDNQESPITWSFRPIFYLNLMRVAWSLTGFGVTAGSLFLGMIMAHQERAARAAFFLTFGIAFALFFGLVLNWFLGLAPIFCVRDGVGAGTAVGRAFEFCAERGGSLLGVSAGFLLLRLVWAGTMLLFLLAPLSLLPHVAVGWVMVLMALVALLYFAGADLLYLARLGAYAALVMQEDEPLPTAIPPETMTSSGPEGLPNIPPNVEPA